jgi:hypothetical protein
MSYGTTEYFSTPDRAHAWFMDEVVTPNPRLNDEEKATIRQVADECYDSATATWWADSAGEWIPGWLYGEDEAAKYFACLQSTVPTVTNDPGILDVLDIAAEASADVADPPDSLYNQAKRKATGEDPVKVPWWVYAGGIAALVMMVRK